MIKGIGFRKHPYSNEIRLFIIDCIDTSCNECIRTIMYPHVFYASYDQKCSSSFINDLYKDYIQRTSNESIINLLTSPDFETVFVGIEFMLNELKDRL